MSTSIVIASDSLDVLRQLDAATFDAVVCDPPAGVAFMGRAWDSARGGRDAWIECLAAIMREACRVLRPGGHALVWALPRTSHWTAMACENAGFEIRDSISHMFGSGFPKSLDVSKAIDAAAGVTREVVGRHAHPATSIHTQGARTLPLDVDITTAATADAQRWSGWGTALKPGHEVWWLCRKPLAGTVAANVLGHGTGALHVDACRVASDTPAATVYGGAKGGGGVFGTSSKYTTEPHDVGRWPPNVVLTHSGACTDAACAPDCPARALGAAARFYPTFDPDPIGIEPFVYVAKPSTREREAGCEALPARAAAELVDRTADSAGMSSPRAGAGRTATARHNTHPTVKPIALMRWLVRLVTPPGGAVIDPFAGSGTTGCACAIEGFDFAGIELDPAHVAIARARIAWHTAHPTAFDRKAKRDAA